MATGILWTKAKDAWGQMKIVELLVTRGARVSIPTTFTWVAVSIGGEMHTFAKQLKVITNTTGATAPLESQRNV